MSASGLPAAEARSEYSANDDAGRGPIVLASIAGRESRDAICRRVAADCFNGRLTATYSYSSGEPGRPPCERCIREQHECILGGSRRGGRRVKRSQSDLSSSALSPADDHFPRPMPLQPPRSAYQSPSNAAQRMTPWIDRESRILPPPVATPTAKMTVDDTVVRSI